jgi:manganese oxidase
MRIPSSTVGTALLVILSIASLGLAACTAASAPAGGDLDASPAAAGGSYLDTTGLRALEVNVGGDRAFQPTGQVVEYTLTAQQVQWELTSGVVTTADTFNGTVPGPTIRVTEGDTLRVAFTNELPQPATIHCHVLHIANEMDGVADLTSGR